MPMWEGGSLCESGNGGCYRVGEKVSGEEKEKKNVGWGAADFLIVFSSLLIPWFLFPLFFFLFIFYIISSINIIN